MSFAPGGSVKESKCQLNHGPSETRSGSSVRTGSQPISECSERNDFPPSTRASSCPPKQSPSTGTSAATASRRRVASRGMNGLESSNRSEEHTSELQSRENLVCRLL